MTSRERIAGLPHMRGQHAYSAERTVYETLDAEVKALRTELERVDAALAKGYRITRAELFEMWGATNGQD